MPSERHWGEKQGSFFWAYKKNKKVMNWATHAFWSMNCRVVCDVPISWSEGLCNACARQLPKQQFLADGNVFLIKLPLLQMVHNNPAHWLALAYQTRVAEQEEEREEEREVKRKRDGRIKKKKKQVKMKWERGWEIIEKRSRERKWGIKERK